MRALALVALVVSLAACPGDEPVSAVAPPRTLAVTLIDPGASQGTILDRSRSQPAGSHTWSGRIEDTVFVQMTAPVTASAVVTPALDSGGGGPDDVYVFFDGAGSLGDIGRRVDDSGDFEEVVVPSTYDVLVAPDALLGRHPSRLITPVTFVPGATREEPLNWELPSREIVTGRVATRTGVPIAGAIVTVFRETEPRLPLGVTVVTAADGSFGFEVPEGRYDLVISAPTDGATPLPTVRLAHQQLPLFPGVELLAEVPIVPVVPVRGGLTRSSGDPVVGRLRFSGRLTDLVPGGSGVPMGRYRVEIETATDGSFAVDLPLGDYEVVGFPRYSAAAIGQTLGTGRKLFSVPFGAESVDGVTVVLADATTVRIEAQLPGGAAMTGATILVRMSSPPRYGWRQVTGASGALEGAWIGGLIPDVYDIELIPPPDEDGQARYARVQVRVDVREQQVVTLQARRSDAFQGFVFSTGSEPVSDVRVELRDPETGALFDATTSRLAGDFEGVFRGLLPR